MKAIGEKCGWVIDRKERRLLKLLRVHAREFEEDIVRNSSPVPNWEAAVRIKVEFGDEKATEFRPAVQIITSDMQRP